MPGRRRSGGSNTLKFPEMAYDTIMKLSCVQDIRFAYIQSPIYLAGVGHVMFLRNCEISRTHERVMVPARRGDCSLVRFGALRITAFLCVAIRTLVRNYIDAIRYLFTVDSCLRIVIAIRLYFRRNSFLAKNMQESRRFTAMLHMAGASLRCWLSAGVTLQFHKF